VSFPSIANQFHRQAVWCERLGSPLYQHLLICSANGLEQGGPLSALLQRGKADAEDWALPLRVMGASIAALRVTFG
jgi:hypothetical protein